MQQQVAIGGGPIAITGPRAVAAAVIGNGLEWYNFMLYGVFAAIIAKLYFPVANPLTSLLLSLGTFSVGFFMRPLGGTLLGMYSDKMGRKAALSLTIMLMCIGTAMIALMPTYAQIGVAAPLLLLLARLVQGFSTGGEMGSATAFMREYAPAGRTTLSVTSLPDGEKRYQNDIYARTTTHMTPNEIHQLGLREIDRIQAEMTAIAKKEGFADLAAFRASLKTNPKYIPTSAEQILDDFRRYIAQMEPKLPELFTLLPKSAVTVEAIPAFQSAAATHYVTGTPDGKRPGRVVVATSKFEERSLVDDEAIAYHEGIPGHHMQLSVQQQLSGLPKFRLHGLGFNAYSEGWALYAEQLGKEVGFYNDPVSDYGRLSSELFRAVRLVVDTGIHSKAWTRDQVVDFFRKSGAVDEPTIQSETDRYIAWPAQALSYKLGQLKIRELRDRAQKELGSKFDIRTFHDEMLDGGTLPLDLLESRTDKWIAEQKSK